MPAPVAAFTRAPNTSRAVAVPTSATHRAMPSGWSIRKATDLPSGDQLAPVKRAPSGRATARAAPPSIDWKLRPVTQEMRLLAGPLLRGLIR